jgi:hypothetical protein
MYLNIFKIYFSISYLWPALGLPPPSTHHTDPPISNNDAHPPPRTPQLDSWNYMASC